MKIRLLFLSFKNLKFYYFIPLLILYLLIPIDNILNVKTYGLDAAESLIMITAQRLIPIISVWWIFCVLKEYIEGDGIELLYVYDNMKKIKTKMIDVLLIFVWYALHVCILFMIYSFFFPNILCGYVIVMIESFVLTGAFYFLIYTFKSTSISLMFILVYYFMSAFFSKNTVFELINIFSVDQPLTLYLLVNKYIFVFAIGIMFFMIGYWMNRKFQRLFVTN